MATAWAVLLARLSSQIELDIGCLVQPSAYLLDLSDVSSVGELLTRLRRATSTNQNHPHSFSGRTAETDSPSKADQSPAFQTFVIWQNDEEEVPTAPELRTEPTTTFFDATRFDLQLAFRENGNGTITGRLSYATALFDAATMERYRGYLLQVLRAMAADAAQPIARIALLDEAERALLLQTWNHTDAPVAQALCIHQRFEQQAAHTPEAVALLFEDQSLTYAQLNAQANQLAHHLIAQGIGPDDRVALCVERGFALVVGLLAILKAGGAYVPLDPVYSSDRLSLILRDAQPRLLLSDAAGRQALGEEALAPLHVVDLDTPQWLAQPQRNPDRQDLAAHHLAYVIYTSGSTGTPKGVMVEHAQVMRLFWA
ncbi:AMP-binding protein, partial [Dyella mobilis]